MTRRKIAVEEGSGNVFADLGFEKPEEEQLRADLVLQLVLAMRRRGISQAQAARILGVDQAKISKLVNGRLGGFSLERLLRFLNALNHDVRIVIDGKVRRRPGRVVVEAA
jgi:predicted XRE-type DNA-binding protein